MIDVPFPPHKHGYVVVPGVIYRGRKQVRVDYLVDTGASMTMVDPRLMESIGYSQTCEECCGPAMVSGPAGKETGYRIKLRASVQNTT